MFVMVVNGREPYEPLSTFKGEPLNTWILQKNVDATIR